MVPSDEPMPIEQAPYRVRREFLLRERRNRRIAMLVAGAVIACAIVGLLRLLG